MARVIQVPSDHMLVWRVEDKNGRGPFQQTRSFFKLRAGAHLPGPLLDSELKPHWLTRDKAKVWVFGFDNPDAYERLVGRFSRLLLWLQGFRHKCLVVPVEAAVVSAHQVLFDAAAVRKLP